MFTISSIKNAPLFVSLLLLPFLLFSQYSQSQTTNNKLEFHSSNGIVIIVEKSAIWVNGKSMHKIDEEVIIKTSKRNRLIEDAGSVFLFLEIDGTPNLNRLYVYKISSNKVDSVVDAISSPIKDYDGDDHLEFGGRDLTEGYDSPDSMYYIPTQYFEIRDGKIAFDSMLTKEMDIRINGIYLAHPLDKDGNCCKVIEKPGKKKVTDIPLVNPLILSERIDGPANIRNDRNGKVIFSLNENVLVSTADSLNGWYMIGLMVDLTETEFKAGKITKGSRLYSDGIEIGKSIQDVNLDDKGGGISGRKGELMGYTAVQNIKPQTLPENILGNLILQNQALTVTQLHDFIKGFQFMVGKMGSFLTYQLDGGEIYGPSAPMRIFMVFVNDKLFAVVHLRKLNNVPSKLGVLKRGYELSVVGVQDQKLVDDFISQFNKWISLAG